MSCDGGIYLGMNTEKPSNSSESDAQDKKFTRVDKSSNSYGGFKAEFKEAKITEALRKSPIPLTPKEIAKITHLSGSTVRGLCRDLNLRNQIVRTGYGRYSVLENLPTLRGVGSYCVPHVRGGVVLDRVHCLVFKGWVGDVGRWVGDKPQVVLKTDFVAVKVHGYATGTVMVYVNCVPEYSFGVGEYQFLVAFLRWLIGAEFDDFKVVNYEFNCDIKGCQIEGAQAVTVKAFGGALKRAYQKAKGIVRVEAKAPVPLSVQQVGALLQGGVQAYNIVQNVFAMLQSVNRLVDAQKFQNELVQRLVNQNRSLIEFLFKERDERARA